MLIGALAVVGIAYAVVMGISFVPDEPSFEASVAKQAPPLPASWGTYRNERFGFEVRYPEGYVYNDTIQLRHEEEEFAVFFYSGSQRDATTNKFLGVPKFTVLKIRNKPELPLSLWVSQKLSQAGQDVEKDIVFGNNHFTRIVQGGATAFMHLLAGSDAVFMLSTPRYDTEAPGAYQEILSNFRVF